MSPGSFSTTLIAIFLGCSNPLAFSQHEEKHGHVHYSCRGWPWTQQQISHETIADDPRSGACVPTCARGDDDQESVWGICLDVPSDIQLLLNFLTAQTKTRRPICLMSSTLILDAERNLSPLMIQRRARSSFDVIVFNQCPRSPQVRLLISRIRYRTLRWHRVILQQF